MARPAAGTGLLARRAWLAGAAGWSAALAGLGGCATAPTEPDGAGMADATAPPATQVLPFSSAAAGAAPAGWRPYALRRDLTRTRYAVVRDGARRVLHARAGWAGPRWRRCWR